MLAFMAGIAPAVVEVEKDIWQDAAALRFLQTHKYESGRSAKERDRVYKRAKASESWVQGVGEGAAAPASPRDGLQVGS